MTSENQSIDEIRDEFRTVWNSTARPWIIDYLLRVSADDRHALIVSLLEIDIQSRLERGESPEPDDYFQFGSRVVQRAAEIIRLFKTGDPDATRTISHTVIGNRPARTTLRRIGPYHLVREIGRGGMGSVWEAEQTEPVQRRVAVKVIRSDFASPDALNRFEMERQAIAMMNHQNIARVLDAGTTPEGSPFFAMELVDGQRLDVYCDRYRLNIRERLELMIPVCRAIQHASSICAFLPFTVLAPLVCASTFAIASLAPMCSLSIKDSDSWRSSSRAMLRRI